MTKPFESFTEGPALSELIAWEAAPRFSRQTLEYASTGADIHFGTVVMKNTDDRVVPLTKEGETLGTAIGVLMENLSISSFTQKGLTLVRGCVVAASSLVWDSSVTNDDKKMAIATLNALGVVVEE